MSEQRPAPHAAQQVSRLLALVPYLHRRGAVHLEEAAADLGVEPRQLVKDLHVLLMCGLPGGYPDDLIDVDLDALVEADGDRVIRVSNADYLDRPLRLTALEASSLVLALRALRGSAATEVRDVVDGLLGKLEAALGDGAGLSDAGVGDAGAADPPGGASAGAAVRAVVDRALAEHRQVRLRYHTASRDELSDRVVDPYRVVEAHGHAYLEGWCVRAEAPRTFRLDRVHEAELLETAAGPERVPPRDLSAELFAPPADSLRATVRLAPRLAWFSEYYPVESSRVLDDGSIEVDLLVADRNWLLRLLLRMAPDAVIVAPTELADELVGRAEEAMRHYTG